MDKIIYKYSFDLFGSTEIDIPVYEYKIVKVRLLKTGRQDLVQVWIEHERPGLDTRKLRFSTIPTGILIGIKRSVENGFFRMIPLMRFMLQSQINKI